MERFEKSKKRRYRKRYMAEEWYEKHKKMAKRTVGEIKRRSKISKNKREIFKLTKEHDKFYMGSKGVKIIL